MSDAAHKQMLNDLGRKLIDDIDVPLRAMAGLVDTNEDRLVIFMFALSHVTGASAAMVMNVLGCDEKRAFAVMPGIMKKIFAGKKP